MQNEIWIVLGTIGQVIIIYFLKNKILDLILRFVQNLNKPLNFIVNFFDGSRSAIATLNYRQQILNVFLVVIAFVMLLAEYSTLEKIVSAASEEGEIFGFNLGVFSAVSYITITVLLGFLGLELIHARILFQGIFYSDPVENSNEKRGYSFSRRTQVSIAITLFLILFIFAYYQGELALIRYETSKVEDFISIQHSNQVKTFYFLLGFFTPIIAALALTSFDIFFAIIVKLVIFIIRLIQKLIASLYLAIEIVIELTSTPVVKLLELFGVFQRENINLANYDKVKPTIRLAPLQNTSGIYAANKVQILNQYHSKEGVFGNLMFICTQLKISISLPNHNQEIKEGTTFADIRGFLINSFYALQGLEFVFKHINSLGREECISDDELPINFINSTDTILISIDSDHNG